MVESIDDCIKRLDLFDDTPELIEWLDNYAESAECPEDRYNFQEISTHLEGLYKLCISTRFRLIEQVKGL